MILEQHKEQVTSNVEPDEVTQVSIESTPEAIKFLIAMLCNLYPKPKDTMMVEYVQNAVDSHDEAGCSNRPIDITLPTRFEPFFIVRDYGIGMSNDVVKGMYTKAMGSTKRNTNDQRGGYGVGKLVFAAYSGVMMLNTWDGENKRIYTFRLKDGDGQIALNTTVPSTEERGVEIKIPINEEDIAYFNSRAQYLYSFLPTRPNIKNNEEIDLNPKASFQNDKFTLLENFMDGTNQSLVTIGGLVFPVDVGECYNSPSWSTLKGDDITISQVLSNLPIVLHFDVGEIEHTPSRSSLMYSEKTINAIRERILVDVRQLAEERFKELLENINSPWDARLTDYQINNKKAFSSKLFSYFKLNKRGVEYNGVEYSSVLPKHYSVDTLSHFELDSNTTLDDPKWVEVYNTEHYQNYHSVRQQYLDHNDKMNTTVLGEVILNDDVHYYYAPFDYSDRKISIKIKHLLQTEMGVDRVQTIILREGETFEQFIDRLQIPADRFTEIDSLENPPKRYRSRAGGTHERVSRDSKVLKWTGVYGGQAAERWEESSLDLKNDKEVYVLIKYYKVWDEETDDYNRINVNRVLSLLKKLLGYDVTLYGVRTTEKDKIGPNMILLDDLVKDTITSIKNDIGDSHKVIKSTEWTSRFSHYYRNIAVNSARIECDAIRRVADRFKKAKAKYNESLPIKQKIEDHNELIREIKSTDEFICIGSDNRTHEYLKKIMDGVEKRYPLVPNFTSYSFNDQFVEYINALNFYRKNNKKSLTV